MPIRQIVYSEDPALRKKSSRVRRVTSDIEQLIEDMFETMRAENGVGLAAIQVGVPVRIIVIEVPEELEDPAAGTSLALLNPKIARTSEEMEDGIEGCLSVPGFVGEVSRHCEITVKGTDPQGRQKRLQAEGYLARVFQHEIDHVNGVLFVDRTDNVWPVEEGEEEQIEIEDAVRRSREAQESEAD